MPSSKRVALKDITRTSAGVNTPTATATACCVAAEGENKPSVTPIVPTNNSSLSWVCAFCGKDDCDFEASLSGLLGPKQPDEEWDLSEPSVPKAGTVAGNNLLMPYDKLRRCVLEILGSKSFLPSNKYIGDAAFELKLKTWLQAKLHLAASDIQTNWCVYRMAAKETMAYKRRQWEARIRCIFVRKMVSLAKSLSVLRHTPSIQCFVFACSKCSTEMEVEAGGNSGVNRATFVKFATECSGPDRDILDSDDDSVDARANYLWVREVGVDSPSTIRLLAWLVFNFVHLVADSTHDSWFAILAEKPLSSWMTASDMAFTFMLLENGVNNWKRIAREQLAGDQFKNDGRPSPTSNSGKGLKHQGGSSGKDAKYRYNGLLRYFYKHFFCQSKTGFSRTNMFLLQSGVNNLVTYRKQKLREKGGRPAACVRKYYPPAFHLKGDAAHGTDAQVAADKIAHHVSSRLVTLHMNLHSVDDLTRQFGPIPGSSNNEETAAAVDEGKSTER